MPISRVYFIVVLALLAILALTSNASPIDPIVELSTPTSVNETSGAGKFTATAVSFPTNLGFNFGHSSVVAGFKTSPTTDGLYTVQTSPSTPSTKTPAVMFRRSPFNSTSDLLSTPESLAAIEESLAAYDSVFGIPSASDVASLSVAHQNVVSDLTSMIPLLSEEDQAAARMITRFITQKLLHPSPGGEERLAQATMAVQNGTRAIAKASVALSTLDEGLEGDYAGTEERCATDSGIQGRGIACSNGKKPKICPNGDPIPASGEKNCPPLAEWQEAQKQDKNLRKHRKKKQKADAARDNMRIARTVFISVGCLCFPYMICPLVFVPGAV